MFDNALGFGDQLFTCVALLVCAGVTSHLVHGFGTRRAKELFVGLVLLLAVSLQVSGSLAGLVVADCICVLAVSRDQCGHTH